MKTNITSVVAILGATVTLNLSALAGPGPQSHFQASPAAGQTSAPARAGRVSKAPTIAFGGTKSSASSDVSGSHEIPYVYTATGRVSAPTVTAVPGAHGTTTYLYRW